MDEARDDPTHREMRHAHARPMSNNAPTRADVRKARDTNNNAGAEGSNKRRGIVRTGSFVRECALARYHYIMFRRRERAENTP
jgi:hypothetical protein